MNAKDRAEIERLVRLIGDEPENADVVHAAAVAVAAHVPTLLAEIDSLARRLDEIRSLTGEVCVHCGWTIGEHGDRGACLRSGFWGNAYDSGLD